MAPPRAVGRAPGGDSSARPGPAPGHPAALLRRHAQQRGRQGNEPQRGRRQAAGLSRRQHPAQEPGGGRGVTHRSADDLSDSIDRWLSQESGAGSFHLADVVEALSDALPTVADASSRERVRRRLAGFNPNPKSAQQVLVERAVDELELIQRRLTGEEYVPWPAVATAAVVVVGTVALAVRLRRPGPSEGMTPARTAGAAPLRRRCEAGSRQAEPPV